MAVRQLLPASSWMGRTGHVRDLGPFHPQQYLLGTPPILTASPLALSQAHDFFLLLVARTKNALS
jgi:hypothetical protein